MLCKLYQIKEDSGYIDRSKIHDRISIGIKLNSMPAVDEIGSVIVRKSIFSKYNLKEILTGVPIDTIYEESNENSNCDWYNHTIKGNKNEYDTFLLVPLTGQRLKIEELVEYTKEHKDIEKFEIELKEMLRKGSNNHEKKKTTENEKANSEELKVKALLRDRKRRR